MGGGEGVAQADLVFPLGNAGAGLVPLGHEAALDQAVEGGQHGGFGQVHHRLAPGELVAAGEQGVDRQGIGVGGDEGFFDENREDTHLEVVQIETGAGFRCGGGDVGGGVGHGRLPVVARAQ